ncbi:MAG: radical SAM protein [Candidatus Omnitrophica bacterium]|nr:radical SAM protein [Candidatus Omnitrophota bacterium]
MKALFIVPPVYDFSAFDLWSKPYGFLFIVDLFAKNGWETFYFDFMDRNHIFYDGRKTEKKYGCGNYFFQKIEKPVIYKNVPRLYKRFGLPQEVFLKFLESVGKPDVILISCGMTYWYQGVMEVIKVCKDFTDAPVITGGGYPSFCSEHPKKTGADIIFQGSDIKKFVEVFNSFTCFDLRYYGNLRPFWKVYKKLSYFVLRTSYGCPFSCYYCGVKKMHPGYFHRDIDDVVSEVAENMENYKFNDIAFYDDGLLCDFNHLKRIIEKLIQLKKFNFHTPNGIHPRFIDREVAWFLKETGFKTLRLSVESFDEKRQKESSFKLIFSEFEEAMKNLVDAKFIPQEIGVYILAGLPGQKFQDVVETVKILKNFPCKIKIAEYSPIPGTIDFEISKKLYPFLPLDEPLFQNNSIFPLWNFDGKWEKIEWLKNLAKS